MELNTVEAQSASTTDDPVVFDDGGHVCIDLPCWTCQYNLRTLGKDAGCPECGTAVAKTIKLHDTRHTRPFTLYTTPPGSRTLGFVLGLLLPIGVVILGASMSWNPITAEWQSGELHDYIGTMLAGRAMWVFYPLLIWAYIAFALVLTMPIVFGSKWWVRLGLWLGVVLGIQYQLIVILSIGEFGGSLVIAVIIGLIPTVVLIQIIANADSPNSYRLVRLRKKRSKLNIGLQIGFTLLLLVGLGATGFGLIIAILASPYLQALCMSAALARLYRTKFDPPREPIRPLPIVVTTASYLAAWPVAITQAQIVYASLPTEQPGCYICTASAYGHRWLTRPTPIQFADGSVMLVTRQMQTLKAAELLLAERLPRLHCVMRAVYDRFGPPLASRIRSPWLADVSYLLFAPLAITAGVILRCLKLQACIDRAYRESF